MISFMFLALCIASFIFLISLIESISKDKPLVALIYFIILASLILYIILSLNNHPSPTFIKEEKVAVINNKAITETCLELNKELGRNLEDGQTVYKIEKIPYWHRGLYWIPVELYTYSLDDPRE